MKLLFGILFTTGIVASPLWAEEAVNPVAAEVPLTEAGQKLEARYFEQLKSLQTEISQAIPTAEEAKKSSYLKATEVESALESRKNEALAALKNNGKATGALNHFKKWHGEATKGLADAKEKLKQAEAMTGDPEVIAKAVKEAQEAHNGSQVNYDKAAAALKSSQAIADEAKLHEAKLTEEVEAARKALTEAQMQTEKALDELKLRGFLASDKLDTQLFKHYILFSATPQGLAKYSQQGREQEKLIETMLADTALMKQIVVADGANENQFGPAMKIYSDIQNASANAKNGAMQRLALAISLELAVPITVRAPESQTGGPTTVDPVKRYLHFEKAYLDGEMDPAFKDFTVWDYRMVIDGDESDEIVAWGRNMLRNYRPDHITNPDYRWRYLAVVASDVIYSNAYRKGDNPDLQFQQNILGIGGVCGRRAAFGRFILRSFGIPTTNIPQPAHAALTHWTPDGWVVCLGAGWGAGNTKTPYGKDVDFLASTQARTNEESFIQVKRAQIIGGVVGETPVFGLSSGQPGFWYGVSLYLQRTIIKQTKAVEQAAVGADLAEANESKEKKVVEAMIIGEEERKIVVGNDGTITIPAVACSKPTQSTEKIQFMKSHLGGMQLHYSRLGNPEEFQYSFDAPTAGTYALTVRVVTPSWKQHLLVAVNAATELIDIELPFTVGMWDTTQPVIITLTKGTNVLTFSRTEPIKGLTIKDITLAPVSK